jgi:hypothetical protein
MTNRPLGFTITLIFATQAIAKTSANTKSLHFGQFFGGFSLFPVREVDGPVEFGELLRLVAVGQYDEQLRVLPFERDECQALPVWTPPNPPAGRFPMGQLSPSGAVQVRDMDVGNTVPDRNQGDLFPVRRNFWPIRGAVKIFGGELELNVSVQLPNGASL